MTERLKLALWGPLGLILVLFIVWSLISAYWYVCSIKGLCTFSLFSRSPDIGLVAVENSPIIKEEAPRVPLHTLPPLGIEDEVACTPYINETDIGGYGNNVLKAERFLNTFEQAAIREDGIHDAETAFAVARFQEHYRPLILTGSDVPSGVLDKKTIDTINMVICNAGGMPR